MTAVIVMTVTKHSSIPFIVVLGGNDIAIAIGCIVE